MFSKEKKNSRINLLLSFGLEFLCIQANYSVVVKNIDFWIYFALKLPYLLCCATWNARHKSRAKRLSKIGLTLIGWGKNDVRRCVAWFYSRRMAWLEKGGSFAMKYEAKGWRNSNGIIMVVGIDVMSGTQEKRKEKPYCFISSISSL